MVYNPGTALSEKWANHFFIAEFRGNPANSPLHAFTLKPSGASFELDQTQEIVSGLLPTGLDWGPDGALYFADWIDGWGVKNEGRIWKLDVPEPLRHPLREETKTLIQSDFSKQADEALTNLLAHADMRIRQKAQFELVNRGEKGYEQLLSSANNKAHQLARIHGLWGIGQLARKDIDYASAFPSFLTDNDPEIQAQAAKMIGDVRYKNAGDQLIALLNHPSLRVQFFAAEALGRTSNEKAVQSLIKMLEANDDKDAWLRHAGALALARIGNADPLIQLKDSPSKALRTAAVVALRRMKDPDIAVFLEDPDEYIVTEAARAINDDYSIEPALPALAAVLKEDRFTGEPLLRRAINANLRVGKEENLLLLSDYAGRKNAPEAMRAEALLTLSGWAKPSVLDRVDGRYRGPIERPSGPAIAAVKPIINDLLNDSKEAVQIAATATVSRLGISEATNGVFALLKKDPSASVREAALNALSRIGFNEMPAALEIALADDSKQVRSTALGLLTSTSLPEEKSIGLFSSILNEGTMEEKQATLTALGALNSEGAIKVVSQQLDLLMAGKASPEIHLDIIEAANGSESDQLKEKLKKYQATKDTDDLLSDYTETLSGGNIRRGQNIFYRNEAAQCVRCHAIWEWGGDAGPVLAGIGTKRSPRELLESVIAPSAKITPGFGVSTLSLKDGTTTAGIVMDDNPEEIKLKIGKEEIKTIKKSEIAEREDVPSSMPGVKEILTKKQIRDLLAFLVSLKEEES